MKDTLRSVFGFDDFRPGQETIINHLLNGQSAAAVFPTGGGKSMCYQLPALKLPGLTLVVSPLIALMKDQIDSLTAKGIRAARLDSTLTADEYRNVLADIRNGQLKLLYIAPERFTNERFRAMLSTVNISLFAVDEAHCISEWGHNFRPDYLKLARFAKDCRADVILALTATATPDVLRDMCTFFDIEPACAVRTQFYRPNLTLLSDVVDTETRDELLLQRIRDREPGAAIVYVTLQKTAERVAQFLKNAGVSARAYHAGLDAEMRAGVQEWFMQSEASVVVATIAFGMGIDKSDIRYVYHYNLPKSMENYAQEIGRAGRDGAPSICETLFCADDLSPLENFVHGDSPERSAISSMVDEIFDQGPDIAVSLYSLSSNHDIRPLVVRTLMTYLQTDGLLEETTPVYSKYQFIPQMSSAEILQNFSGERREFLLGIFRQSTKAKKWFSIDLDSAAAALKSDRVRLVKALDYLAEQNMLELKPSGLIHRYRRLQVPDRAELTQSLFSRMQNREQRDLQRLHEIVELMTHPGCQVSRLSAYFGEPLEKPCGHCSRCLKPTDAALTFERRNPPIDENQWREIEALRQETPVLESPILFTRFLCGISSPKLVRAKLSRHKWNGIFADIPYQTILDRVSSS